VSPARDPQERALIARIANAERLAKHPDRSELTAAANAGRIAKFERLADPDGKLPPDKRAQAAHDLMRAHMLRMTLKAKQGREKAARYAKQARDAEAELASLTERAAG
jgi:hypothetical protein